MGATLQETLAEINSGAAQGPSSPRAGARPGATPARGVAPRPSGGGAAPIPPAQKPKESWWDWGVGVVKGIGAGALRAPGAALGGTLDFAADVGNEAGNQLAKVVSPTSLIGRGAVAFHDSNFGRAWNSTFDPDMDGRTDFAGIVSGRDSVGKVGNATANQLTADILSIAIGYGALAKGAKATRLGSKAQTTIATLAPKAQKAIKTAQVVTGGAAAGAVIMDPEEERFSNVLQGMGLQTAFTDYLAHDDQEGVWEGRWKNAVEGTATGFAAEGIFRAGKYFVKALKGDHAAAQAVQAEIQQSVLQRAKAEGHDIPEPRKIEEAAPDQAILDKLDEAEARGRFQQMEARARQNGDYEAQQFLPDDELGVTGTDKPAQDVSLSQTAEASVDEAGAASPFKEVKRSEDGTIFLEYTAADGTVIPNIKLAPTETKGLAEIAVDQFGNSANKIGPSEMRRAAAALKKMFPEFDTVEGFRKSGAGKGRVQTVKLPVERANRMLEQSGVEPNLAPDNIELTPDGRIRVTPEAKRLLNQNGFGAAFASTLEQLPKDTILLRASPEGGAGVGRVLGSIGREGLAKLGEDIKGFQADIENVDVTRESAKETAARVGEFKLSPLGSVDKVGGTLRGIVERLPDTGPAKSDEELARLAAATANSIGEDPTAILEASRLIAGRLGDADTAMATLRAVWTRSAKNIDDLNLDGVDWNEVSDDAVEEAAAAIHQMATLSSYVQEAKQGLGRGLRVNKLPDADTYLGTLGVRGRDIPPVKPRELAPLPRTREELKDWMDLWGMTKADPKSRAAFLEGTLTVPAPGKYLRSSFANFFTASILSAPKTIGLNVIGPGFISVVRNLERFSGAAVASLNPALSSAERAGARKVARYTATAYVQTLGDISDVFRQGLAAAKQNHTIIGGGGQTVDTVGTYGPLTDNLIKASGASPDWRYSLGNLINVWPKAFARLNNGLDEFSKRLAYQGEIRIKAMVEGSEQGLHGDGLSDFVRERLTKSYDEVGHAADDALLREAERTTLTSRVGEEGTWVRRFSTGVQQLRQDIPEVRFLLPVFNVPANALGETLRRLPIAFLPGVNKALGFEQTAKALAGELGPIAQAEAHGRFMMGAAFLTAGVLMNRAGLLTGAGPQEPTDRKVWLQTHQPYSIRMGDEWVRYDKFDILGGLLSIPATITDATTHRAADESMSDLLSSGAGALAQWFKDRAAFRTAASLLSAGDDPTKDTGKLIQSTTGNIAAGFFPAALRTTLTDTTDPYNRMKRSWDDYLQAALPGLSQQLEPVRNVLGEPVQRAADSFSEALFPVTMSPAVTFQSDPVMDELDRVYQTTGYGAGADPKSIGYGFFDPRDVKLEDGRSIYDNAMRRRQAIKVDGMTLRQTLLKTINSPTYNSAVDADSGSRKTSLGDLSRGYMLRKIFEAFNQATKADIARTSPIGAAWLTAAAAKQRDDAYLREFSAEDLVNNPALYKAKGIDALAYTAKLRKAEPNAIFNAEGVE